MNDRKNSMRMAACGCDAQSKERTQRKALAVDPELKAANIKRLRRVEGQIRGLQKMVQQDRYCTDILIQISSVQEALRGVSRNLMRNHLRHCASHAIRSGRPIDGETVYEEILDLMDKHTRL
jgi:CsoR family transcriptional regulator, copper-sensing transcriptional repressor